MTRLLVVLLKAYRLLISPMLVQRCRYYPSCSAYALGAVQTHGALRGSWLAMRRLGRCHPWSAGGVDFVPPRNAYRWWGLVPGMDGSSDPDAETAEQPSHPHASRADSPVLRGA
jgi:putative membrane protein insertion efficiency factor